MGRLSPLALIWVVVARAGCLEGAPPKAAWRLLGVADGGCDEGVDGARNRVTVKPMAAAVAKPIMIFPAGVSSAAENMARAPSLRVRERLE